MKSSNSSPPLFTTSILSPSPFACVNHPLNLYPAFSMFVMSVLSLFLLYVTAYVSLVTPSIFPPSNTYVTVYVFFFHLAYTDTSLSVPAAIASIFSASSPSPLYQPSNVHPSLAIFVSSTVSFSLLNFVLYTVPPATNVFPGITPPFT